MHFNLSLFVQFLNLTLINLPPDILVFVSETKTMQLLNDIQEELHSNIPAIQFSFNEINENQEITNYCLNCPRNQLVIILMPIPKLWLAQTLLGVRFVQETRVVVLFTKILDAIEEFAIFENIKFMNPVLVQSDGTILKMMLCRNDIFAKTNNQFTLRSYFDDPSAIFHSNDTNAMVFRRQMDNWFSASSYFRVSMPLMAPYNFMIKRRRNGQSFIVSATIGAFQIIANHFGCLVQWDNMKIRNCTECEDPLLLRHNRRQIPLFRLSARTPKPCEFEFNINTVG